MLCKKAVIKNVANFTGKHLCWSLFLIKLEAWSKSTAMTLEERLWVFPSVFIVDCEQVLVQTVIRFKHVEYSKETLTFVFSSE